LIKTHLIIGFAACLALCLLTAGIAANSHSGNSGWGRQEAFRVSSPHVYEPQSAAAWQDNEAFEDDADDEAPAIASTEIKPDKKNSRFAGNDLPDDTPATFSAFPTAQSSPPLSAVTYTGEPFPRIMRTNHATAPPVSSAATTSRVNANNLLPQFNKSYSRIFGLSESEPQYLSDKQIRIERHVSERWGR
jgi:hypothetical protein